MSKEESPPPMIFGGEFIGGNVGTFLQLNNIAWRIEPGALDPANPLFEPRFPWDNGGFGCGHGTVLKDPIDGLYKAWVTSIRHHRADGPVLSGTQFRLAYAQSPDGVNWDRPQLDLCPWEGFPKTNIIFDYDSGGPATYASVFIDPDEDPDEPYEMFVFRRPGEYGSPNVVAGFPDSPARGGLYRYRSNDGIHWRGVEGPLDIASGDTLYVHKDPAGGYVAHHKGGGMPDVPAPIGGRVPYDVYVPNIRISQRRTSPDGTHWSAPVPIMFPDWMDAPGDQIMELGRYPYGSGYIASLAIYHAMSQTLDLQFAASCDGLNWWRPIPRRPCVPLAPLGDYGGGMLWPTRTFVEDNDHLHLYFGALEGLHGDLYSKLPSANDFHGAFCRASWRKGRMWAAVPGGAGYSEGTLVVYPDTPDGRTLYINGVTKDDGEIRVELLDASETGWPLDLQAVERIPRNVLTGYSYEDAAPFVGDHLAKPLAWRGRPVPHPVCMRIRLRRARLYGYEWR